MTESEIRAIVRDEIRKVLEDVHGEIIALTMIKIQRAIAEAVPMDVVNRVCDLAFRSGSLREYVNERMDKHGR